MKNLFKSASCGNPAKFVWEVGDMDSNEAENSKLTALDYKNVEDLNTEDYKSANVIEENNQKVDPDVDDDFMKEIETEGITDILTRYADISKKIFDILPKDISSKIKSHVEKSLGNEFNESERIINKFYHNKEFKKDLEIFYKDLMLNLSSEFGTKIEPLMNKIAKNNEWKEYFIYGSKSDSLSNISKSNATQLGNLMSNVVIKAGHKYYEFFKKEESKFRF